jgi:hypothetical protein
MRYKTEGMPIHLSLKESNHVVLLERIEDGLIVLEPQLRGRIVRLQNQVSAEVWFSQIGIYGNDPIRIALKLSGSYSQSMQGIVMHLAKSNFSVLYSYEEHDNIRIREERALSIPYFYPDDESMKMEGIWYVGDKHGIEYPLGYIKDACDETFSDFVSKLKQKKITKAEREDRNYPESAEWRLTDASELLYNDERKKLELAFARVTGVYAEFFGGLVFE